jgi:hypothetical protein
MTQILLVSYVSAIARKSKVLTGFVGKAFIFARFICAMRAPSGLRRRKIDGDS